MKTIIGELFQGHGNPNKIKQRLEAINSTFTCMISDFEPCDIENWKEISLSNPSSFINSIEEVKPYAESSDIYYIRAKKSNKTRAFYQAPYHTSPDFKPFDRIDSVTRGCTKMNNVTINDVMTVHGQPKSTTKGSTRPLIDDLINQLGIAISQSTIDEEIKATKLRLKVLKLFKNNRVQS
jgi:hypothetical protein